MPKAKMKRAVIPKFSSESEEAAWWDAHRSEIEAEIRQRMKQKRPLTLDSLLQGEKASQPVTLRIATKDLETARRLAAQKGVGYQTYIKMLLREALAKNPAEQMSLGLQSKLERLRSDYSRVTGTPFSYFFCPVLFRDEDVTLSESHIVNVAFPDSPRAWTVQRKDVDSFYGSRFEADFVDIQYNQDPSLGKTVTDRNLHQRLKPQFLADDVPIEHFIARDKVPDQFAPVVFESDGESVQLGFKISREDMLAATTKKWQLSISKDVRVPALVSLIKAAHLTLFEMLGYRYALSAGGHFVGRDILGEFFVKNYDKRKAEVLENALRFFREFAAMVRPVESCGSAFQGTVVDRKLFLCKDDRAPMWAFIVFIKISQSLHAVMVPIFGQSYKFMNFLHDEKETITAFPGRFELDHWTIDNHSIELSWPKTGILYP